MKIDELAKDNTVWNLIYELSTKQGITEIMINGSNNIYIERDNEFIRLNVQLVREHIKKFCQDIAAYNKKVFNDKNPIIDGRLPDGSRVNIISDSYTTGTPAITIRKYLKQIRTFESVDEIFGLKNKKWFEFFKTLVKAKCNILVSGGTGVGKTTFLNLLLQEIPKDERVITIEDTRELQFNLTNVVRLEAKNEIADENKGLNIRQLLKNTLRMRPDRIIVGEVRAEEAFDLLQAMNTGHNGSMTSIHANTPGECVGRLENLFILAGYDIPIRAIRYQIVKAVDYIIQIGRNKNGERVVTKVSEVTGIEQERILLQDIGVYEEDRLNFTGLVPAEMKKLMDSGLSNNFFDNPDLEVPVQEEIQETQEPLPPVIGQE